VTSDGAAYYERCLQILSDVREAEESLSNNRVSPSGRLRVDVSTGMASDIIIPALPDFFPLPRHPPGPGLQRPPVDLIEEGVDCAIRGGEPARFGIDRAPHRRAAVSHRRHTRLPAEHGRPAAPARAANHRCINYFSSKTGKTFDWDFVRGDETIFIPAAGLPGGQRFNCLHGSRAARPGPDPDGQLPGRAYACLGPDGTGAGGLDQHPLPINVVYPQNRHLSAKVRVFVEWVADLFAAHPRLQLQVQPKGE
jgi:LysR family transcriptional regulator for bpeEF and oprC